jgi:DNA-binding NarL/FixJ family response regulator
MQGTQRKKREEKGAVHTSRGNAKRGKSAVFGPAPTHFPIRAVAAKEIEEPATVPEPTTVLIVEQHALVRDGLREILESQRNLAVVDEADNNASAVSKAAAKRPHVVLLDTEVPGDTVTSTVRRIGEVSPESKVIILSEYDDANLLRRLLTLGIRGYLLKNSSRQDLIAAVRGGRSRNDTVLLAVSRGSLTQVHADASEMLSDREREVLQLTAYALSNAQIAGRLHICEATVKRHLRNIFVKLEAVSRIDAVNKAIAASLIARPETASHVRNLLTAAIG